MLMLRNYDAFQVTVARNTKENLPPQVKSVRKVPTYQIQGMYTLTP